MDKRIWMVGLALAIGLSRAGLALAWNEGDPLQSEALKLTPDIAKGRELYNVICSGCHEETAWGTSDGTFPEIAGQHRSVLIKQLTDIRALNRDNPVMYPFTLPGIIGGAQEIADVTAYVESMPVSRHNGLGPGTALDQGKQLYNERCASCHGAQGEGSAQAFYPRIQGQHYAYVLRQLNWMKNGKRRNANPEMLKHLKGFSSEEMSAVSDYIAHMKP